LKAAARRSWQIYQLSCAANQGFGGEVIPGVDDAENKKSSAFDAWQNGKPGE
jgi:hypothetical protein